MRRTRLLLAALAAAAAVVLPAAPPAGAAPAEPLTVVSADLTGQPDVRLVLAAPPQLADAPLDPAAFSVAENGQPRQVRVEALPADQLEVALVIDTSGSMNGAPLAAAKAAAQSFLGQLPPAVPVSVTGFGAKPAVASPRSTDRAGQLSAVAALRAGGDTALYDAVNAALGQLPAGGGTRRVVVLLSDGGDTSSAATLDTTTDALAAAKVPLFAVELRTTDSNPAALARLSSATGGRVVPANDPAALAGAFDAVARQVVRQYAVTYRSQAQGPVDVDVVVDARGVRATARHHLELPTTAAAPTPAPAAAPSSPGAATSGAGSWALYAGVGLTSLAMLVLLLGLLGGRAPRARGLGLSRRTPLEGAAQRAEAVGDAVLDRAGASSFLGAALDAAGLDARPGEVVVAVAVADVVGLLVGWRLASPVVGVLLAVAVLVAAKVGLDHLARRRRDRFSDQLPETLQLLAGSLRGGNALAQAIDTVAREAESPTSEEFRRLTIETRLGRDFGDALGALGGRVGSEDFRWVVQAVDIQREVGGDLAQILDSVAATMRDRQRVRRQVSALSAEGRMSAWVLIVLPFALAGLMLTTNAAYLRPLTSGAGLLLLAAGGVLELAGVAWLRRIVKPVF
jgi:tight adherence protein B